MNDKFIIILFYFLCFYIYLLIPAMVSFLAVSQLGGMFYFFGLSWVFSISFFSFFILLIVNNGPVVKFSGILFGTILSLLNTFLAIYFLTQGVPFNTQFFTHIDLSTLRIAWATDTIRLVMMILYISITPFVIYGVLRKCSGKVRTLAWQIRVPLIGLMILMVISTSYPLQAIVIHKINTSQSSERMIKEVRSMRNRTVGSEEVNGAGRNIVMIYLEGVEQNYFDENHFPDLMPNLTTIRERALWFQDVEQFPGTSWTIGGIVGSQCGVPLLSAGHGNRILAAVDNPFRHISCLAEILKKEGYQTVFLGGASLDFAGKGQFLRDNGYDLALGIDDLPKASRHKWGMFDRDLYQHGKELFDGLASTEEPFLLTMLTLDTHHPDGTPSPECPPYGVSDETLLNAVHCADILVADFIEHVQASSVADDTIIAIISDHLLINGEPEEALSQNERRLTFIILDPSRVSERFAGQSTHFDVAPTILDVAGMDGAEFLFGHSLLDNEEGLVFDKNLSSEDFLSFEIQNLISESNIKNGVVYFPGKNLLKVGKAKYYSRDPINVHYDTPFHNSSQFIGLYFQSYMDRYPEILYGIDEFSLTLRDHSNGVVVVASNGHRVCFREGPCFSGPLLGVYDLANDSLLRPSESSNKDSLEINRESIVQFTRQK